MHAPPATLAMSHRTRGYRELVIHVLEQITNDDFSHGYFIMEVIHI